MPSELNFKEWLHQPVLSDVEIANLYFHHSHLKIDEIAQKTHRSTGAIYRIVNEFGRPNRQITNHENVRAFAQAGMPARRIAEFSGYSTRHVNRILGQTHA